MNTIQVIECLRKNQEALSSKCHAMVFKREVRLTLRRVCFDMWHHYTQQKLADGVDWLDRIRF